jgi:site-specific recombinase XerC
VVQTAVALMLEGGADIRYVSDMLGHDEFETTSIYTRVSIANLHAVHAATHPAGNNTVGADNRLLQPVPGSWQTS